MDFSLKCSPLLPIFGLHSVVSVFILSWQRLQYFSRPKWIFLVTSFAKHKSQPFSQHLTHEARTIRLRSSWDPPAGILLCKGSSTSTWCCVEGWLHRGQRGHPRFCRISPRVDAEAPTLVSSASSWHGPQLAKLKGKAQLLRSTCFDWQI